MLCRPKSRRFSTLFRRKKKTKKGGEDDSDDGAQGAFPGIRFRAESTALFGEGKEKETAGDNVIPVQPPVGSKEMPARAASGSFVRHESKRGSSQRFLMGQARSSTASNRVSEGVSAGEDKGESDHDQPRREMEDSGSESERVDESGGEGGGEGGGERKSADNGDSRSDPSEDAPKELQVDVQDMQKSAEQGASSQEEEESGVSSITESESESEKVDAPEPDSKASDSEASDSEASDSEASVSAASSSKPVFSVDIASMDTSKGPASCPVSTRIDVDLSSVFLNITLVGDSGSGKSSFLACLASLDDAEMDEPSLFDSCRVLLDLGMSRKQGMLVWDTESDEEFVRFRALNYNMSDLFILCFSLLSEESMLNVQSEWIPELRQTRPKAPVILLGTKADLRDKRLAEEKAKGGGQVPEPSLGEDEYARRAAMLKRKLVTKKRGSEFAKSIGAERYIECSCIRSDDIVMVLRKGCDMVIQAHRDRVSRAGKGTDVGITPREHVE